MNQRRSTSWRRRGSRGRPRGHGGRCAARALAVVIALIAGGTAFADWRGIRTIGTLTEDGMPSTWAEAVSSDGSTVVGACGTHFPMTSEAFYWRDGTITGLGDLAGAGEPYWAEPFSGAHGVNADGSIIVGWANSALGTQAARWYGGHLVAMGDLPGGAFDSEARAIAQNGVIVGRGSSAQGNEAFRWQSGSMTGLGDLPGGAFDSAAHGVSADGSVVVGTGTSAAGREAFVCENGQMTGLGDLPGGDFSSEAVAASADGSTVVGWGTSRTGIYHEAFLWRDGLMIGLGDLPGGNIDSEACAVSGDGSIVVGRSSGSFYGYGAGPVAFIWDAAHGMRTLHDALAADYGLDLTGWELYAATGISADGRTIVGVGSDPEGLPYGFIVSLPEPAALCMLALGAVIVAARQRRWG
jgi:probable HAF family extracellular repeat protein